MEPEATAVVEPTTTVTAVADVAEPLNITLAELLRSMATVIEGVHPAGWMVFAFGFVLGGLLGPKLWARALKPAGLAIASRWAKV